MPAEIRYIAFPPVEVVRAITEYQTRRRDPLPSGAIVGFDVLATPAIEAELRLVDNDSGMEKTVIVRSEQLAAALVLFCINRKVPVPAKAHKLLYAGRDGGVVMGYALGLDDGDRADFAATVPPVFVEPPVRSGRASSHPDGVIAIEDEAPAPPAPRARAAGG